MFLPDLRNSMYYARKLSSGTMLAISALLLSSLPLLATTAHALQHTGSSLVMGGAASSVHSLPLDNDRAHRASADHMLQGRALIDSDASLLATTTSRPRALLEKEDPEETDFYKEQLANPTQVSVVIMNWKRPQNVRKILGHYKYYDNVAEIIVWMCNPNSTFRYKHKKIRLIDDPSANDVDGLSTRFRGCLLAKSPWVLIQDDDHMTKPEGIQALLEAKAKDPKRLIGTYSREWPDPEKPQYIPLPCPYGPHPIVLTILMLADRATCKEFWRYAPLVQDYVHDHSKPLWNGEDIFYSLVSFKYSGQLPLSIGVPKVSMPQRKVGIHLGAGHDSFRDNFVRYAADKLKISYKGQIFGKPKKDLRFV
eukprot:gene30063-35032_t